MSTRYAVFLPLFLLPACNRGGAPGPTEAASGAVLATTQEARDAVGNLRARFQLSPAASTAPRRAGVNNQAGQRPALPAAVAERFEATTGGIVPRFAGAAQAAPHATVILPARADGALRVRDAQSGVSLSATLIGARATAAQAADGMLIYRGGYAGFDLVHRPTLDGTEDFVHFASAPATAEVKYTVELGEGVSGLRLVANTLEAIDAAGAPRLRLAPPYVVDAAGALHGATLSVSGCAVDTSAAAPWGRDPVKPGSSRCEVRVAWDGKAVQYPALLDPAWTATGSMTGPRDYHKQIMLNTGNVLAVGGENAINSVVGTCELYNPGTTTWAATGSLATARRSFGIVALAGGNILVTGGLGGPIVATTEIYDPGTGNWSPSGNLNTPRFEIATFRLTAGPNANKVIAAGGRVGGQVGVTNSEIFDPGAGTWAPTNPINTARGFDFASAVQLSDGSPLIAGGASPMQNWLSSVEKYDQVAGTWSFVAPMSIGREDFSLTVLSDGKVLAAGGDVPGNVATDTTELYNPAGNTWTPAANFPDGPRLGHTATALSGNRVLITAGANDPGGGWTTSTLLWSEAGGAWVPSGDLLFNTTTLYGQTALNGNSVLVSGGVNGNNSVPSKSEAQIFTPVINGGTCTQPGECNSGFCVGGVCCNTACTPGPHQTADCSTGTCNLVCDPCWVDGNGLPGDGCELTKLACGSSCSPAAGCGYTDSDGDGLNDVWESQLRAPADPTSNGYVDINCNGKYDVGADTPLPDAHVKEPDVYVKWDYMDGGGAHNHKPTPAAMTSVQTAYEGHHSHLHYFPTNDSIAEHKTTVLAAAGALPASCTGPDSVSFYDIKTAHFPAFLKPAYHYAIFVHYNTCDNQPDCNTCPATSKSAAAPHFGLTGLSELPGNDFVVSFGQLVELLGGADVPDILNAGTFMHELGHNLSLHHGGFDELDQKPNYISVMNHTYQFGVGATSVPGPYDTSSVDPSESYHVDYSTFEGGALLEGAPSGSNTCISDGSGGMNETKGILTSDPTDTDVAVFYTDFGGTTLYAPSNGTAINWDNSAPATNPSVYADVSGDGACSVLTGYNDWAQSSPMVGVFQDTNLSIGFQCNTGFWADGAAVPGNLEDRELTGAEVFGRHKVYPFKHVTVMVRPTNCGSKWITLSGPGNVSVAALGSASFDVTQVDPASLRFAGAAPVSTSIADVNGDGFTDIVGDFPMASLHLSAASTTASLIGALQNSQAFGGTDSITIAASQASGGKCTGTIAGAVVQGNLDVPAGATCTLIEVTVKGNVSVGAGGTLTVLRGSITGNVQAHSSASLAIHGDACGQAAVSGNVQADATPNVALGGVTVGGNLQPQQGGVVTVTGCSVHGNLQVHHDSGPIAVGNNTVGGNLQVHHNDGGTAITGNTVQGNLQAQHNNGGTSVTGNTVHGNTQCQGNTPAATGQCSG